MQTKLVTCALLASFDVQNPGHLGPFLIRPLNAPHTAYPRTEEELKAVAQWLLLMKPLFQTELTQVAKLILKKTDILFPSDDTEEPPLKKHRIDFFTFLSELQKAHQCDVRNEKKWAQDNAKALRLQKRSSKDPVISSKESALKKNRTESVLTRLNYEEAASALAIKEAEMKAFGGMCNKMERAQHRLFKHNDAVTHDDSLAPKNKKQRTSPINHQ